MKSSTVFYGGRLVLPDQVLENHHLIIRNDRIDAIRSDRRPLPKSATPVSLRGGYLTPGLIDLHVHGGGNADFMDGTPEAVWTVCRTHLLHGTTTLFPTTTTGSPAQIQAMISSCQQLQTQHLESPPAVALAKIGGVHLYGPFFAEGKVGCHSPDHRRAPELREYRQYFKSNIIKIATCAAELPGATAFYRYAARRGCLVTCGHSNSTYSEMQSAFAAGMRHVDHFWCAMSSVSSLRARCGTPMQASMEQFVLIEPEMSTEVIADGCHLSKELLNFAFRLKGADRLCLVTDASRALDQAPGQYRFGSQVDGPLFYSDGKVGWTTDRTGLASSVAGMDRMLRTMLTATKAPLPEVVRMASLTPARRTGLESQIGSLEVGKKADLVLWSSEWKVRQVFVDGVSSLPG